MKVLIPRNFYASVFMNILGKNDDLQFVVKESSLLAKELEHDTSAVALIPSMDLIKHRNLFVSGKTGISFDGALSNAYFYLSQSEERSLANIFVRGDISVNEIILTKVLFEEKYSSKVEVTIDTNIEPDRTNNFLVVGDANFKSWDFKNSISFADQITDMVDLPYVNFVAASQDRDSIEMLNQYVSGIDELIEDSIDDIITKTDFDDDAKLFIRENLNSIYYEITQNEVDALEELMKIVYYRGILDDMFDIKIV